MRNADRADDMAVHVLAFAEEAGLGRESPETVAGDMICNVLHWVVAQSGQTSVTSCTPALTAVRRGLGLFLSEFVAEVVHNDPEDGPDAHVTIAAVCSGHTFGSVTHGDSVVTPPL